MLLLGTWRRLGYGASQKADSWPCSILKKSQNNIKQKAHF